MIQPKKYYRIMLGKGGKYAEECRQGNFIGADFGIDVDLTGKLPENWRKFNKEFIPVYLEKNPDKSKVAAGLACGAIHTITKGLQIGDIVLSPDGSGSYMVGEISGGYSYHPGEILPHHRQVSWYPISIDRSEMSQPLQYSTGAIGTVSNITKHIKEIQSLIEGDAQPDLIATDETVEDPSAFAIEKHLEEFLVNNWKKTSLGNNYQIFEDEGELVGQQYPTDTGAIDILAISKDGKEILVVELKKGRASDAVVGQIQRYMGYVLEELAEEGQAVRGVIIALEEDLRIKRALQAAPTIDFYRYQISFKLFKEG